MSATTWRGFASGLLAGMLVMLGTTASAQPTQPRVVENLALGVNNQATAQTTLQGPVSSANLRLINTASGYALELRVSKGTAPLKVNSRTRVPSLNADLLDGKHAGAFLLLATYDPDKDGKVTDADLLDGLNSTAFSLTGHDHTGVYLPFAGKAANADLLDGLDSTAFVRQGGSCLPGATVIGYGRSGPICSTTASVVTIDSIGDVGQWASLVLDASGHPVIAYHDASNGDLKLAHCNDPLCSGGDESVEVVDAANVGQYASLVLDASGFPVIAYYDIGNTALRLAHCNDPNCAGGNESLNLVDNSADVGKFASLALDAAGYPVIAYYDATSADLKLAHCNDPNCVGGDETITPVDTLTNIGAYASLVLDTAGRPVIAYQNGSLLDLRLVRCGDSTCSGGNIFTTVDGTGDVGRYASLTLDAYGSPAVAYYDLTNGDLKVARCSEATCAAGVTTRVADGFGNIGQHASIALSRWGHPVVAYLDVSNTELRVVRCGDAACSAGNSVAVLDSIGTVGQHASLTLDRSGNPVVAYYDATNGALKLAVMSG